MKKVTNFLIFLTVLSCSECLVSFNEESTVKKTKQFQAIANSGRMSLKMENIVDEITVLQAEFNQNVSSLKIDEPDYLSAVFHFINDKMNETSRAQELQYFVFVDRNENRQNIMVGFFKTDGTISVIGWDKVSTGNPMRAKHYITPTGIFENSVKHMSYRAQGTRNSKGWMGLGVKNSRVWDFGWQKSIKKGFPFDIRMMMHATDPNFGEPRLGKRDSKGCIRVSAKMNNFLDLYGIIDSDYEDHPKQGKRIFRKDRKIVSFSGRYLIIGDFE
ncbi:MAG: hypothetical protein COU29_04265 [Candidatus Magasanikbacteria bacterium CG10_big_fil_rev_8_21_14_0_10_36_32]|uniref:L,D-TPase catalytic domain-containing protein n=1 Tax=Candidatus Magasanikbacteria bacterium CG10_big_fil_rev_8_21_14_0_10_36_32 TaxID=1974646 RepID=A0A2M6W5C7_9BACT|nr:MAG: hypothetical protein COU29_04265 [Candidatus Magasanikbacteria bacterium CG10_big_fil_rev_8_21_14_0_10_36_32]